MTLTSSQHRWIYLIALALVVIGLPFSRAFISIGELILAANFILEGRWPERIQRLKSDPSIWLFLSIYLIHIIGLSWSSDLQFGVVDLRNKLPLLLFPIVIPLSQRLTRREFLWMAAIFSAAVIASSGLSTYQYLAHRTDPDFNFRDISLFTSHIRYSLMVCLGYIILLNCAWNEEKKLWLRFVYVGLAIWMSIFLFILQSMTGIVIWFLCSYMLLFYTLFYFKHQMRRAAAFTILCITPLFLIFYLFIQIDAYYPDTQPNFSNLDPISEAGEFYHHDTTNLMLENGNYINIYISHPELKQEWDKVSDIQYHEGLDLQGHYVYSTLIRYMTSKGLRKDSAGFSQLSMADIDAVESGVPNIRFLYGNALDNRIYTVIWEIDKMVQEKEVQGHSVSQRFEYWSTGWQVFLENPIIGVGTGDLGIGYHDMYDRLDSKLSEKYRLRSHNQFLNFMVCFGLIGFLLILVAFAWPFAKLTHANSFLYIGFSIIMYASMLNEDTLETQVGVTTYAFFNAFFLYSLTGISRRRPRTDS
ncbi:MAG TPA: hypothetical protein DCX14_02430 [Flavobacteriales bacterium]|nr:hypothetical protein [Flavobacteriales bacterium]